MTVIRIAAAAALFVTSGAAFAQSADDARCLILSNAYAKQTKDANAQKMAEASVYFYLGRIGAGATAAQLKTLFEQQTKTITEAGASKMMTACANTVQGKLELVQSIAKPAAPAQPQGR